MELIKTPANKRSSNNIYSIDIKCCLSTGSRATRYLVWVEPEEIEKTILEIFVFMSQFPNPHDKRWMNYDLTCLFLNDASDDFGWLKNFPKNGAGLPGYRLDNFEIKYFDENGQDYDIAVKDIPEKFVRQVEEISWRWQRNEMGESFHNDRSGFDRYINQLKSLIDVALIEIKTKKNNYSVNKQKI